MHSSIKRTIKDRRTIRTYRNRTRHGNLFFNKCKCIIIFIYDGWVKIKLFPIWVNIFILHEFILVFFNYCIDSKTNYPEHKNNKCKHNILVSFLISDVRKNILRVRRNHIHRTFRQDAKVSDRRMQTN